MSDDDHEDDEQRRIAGILFSGMLGGNEDADTRKHRRERHAAEHDDMKNRMFEALTSMTSEQLFMVRQMLINGMNNKKALHWFDGIICALLQVQHGVDPDSGKTPEEILLQERPAATPAAGDGPDDRT